MNLRLVPKGPISVLILVLSLFALAGPSAATPADDGTSDEDGLPSSEDRLEALRVFLDCDRGCDFNFLRREIVYVNYVRDRRDAQVHVLVTREGSGSGSQYTLNFHGLEGFEGVDQTLLYFSSSTDTDDEQRRGFARILQLGLVRYVSETPLASGLQVSYRVPRQNRSIGARPEDDPWNFWVFRASGRASLSDEDRRDASTYSGFFSASRTTELWRTGLSVGSEYRENNFEFDDGETFKDVSRSGDVGARFIRSLGDHWGVGLGSTVRRSTFLNLDPSYRLAGSIEYNIFPYSQSSERALTFSYFLGGTELNYEEQTIFGELSETRPDQGMFVAFDIEQPWGESSLDLEASHFIDDTDLYRVELRGRVDWRIVRGLSINVNGSASLVRDQIYLPNRGATDEEILLGRRALETDARLGFSVGLSYTFGSIFNNVVNSRFANRGGGFHRIF